MYFKFLNSEDEKLPEEELYKKLAWEIVDSLNPKSSKKRLFLHEYKLLSTDLHYFRKMDMIYLKENKNEN